MPRLTAATARPSGASEKSADARKSAGRTVLNLACVPFSPALQACFKPSKPSPGPACCIADADVVVNSDQMPASLVRPCF